MALSSLTLVWLLFYSALSPLQSYCPQNRHTQEQVTRFISSGRAPRAPAAAGWPSRVEAGVVINDRDEAPLSLSHGQVREVAVEQRRRRGAVMREKRRPFPPLPRSEAALGVLLACGDGEENN